MDDKRRIGVFLLQMGGPLHDDELHSYVESLFCDPFLVQLPPIVSWFRRTLAKRVASRRAPVLRQQYEQIGGSSPNNAITIRQAVALEDWLNQQDNPNEYHCFAAMTYTRPRIESAVADAVHVGCTDFVALSLFPQYCSATTGSSFAELAEALDKAEISPDNVRWVSRWGDNDQFLAASAENLRLECEASARAHSSTPHVLFSAHGIPESYVRRGDPYVSEIQNTVRLLAETLVDGVQHSLSYQSRATPLKWVTPSTDGKIKSLAEEGVKSLIVHPVSFVNDHLETLFEIDIELAAVAKEAGIEHYARVPVFNDDPRLIALLGQLVFNTRTP